ncbi:MULTISPECIES: hypothetical protein [unclassified Isoptericola]|uniref:hypothetical protein n=1 Tax=unclassified Isoptericola TaxID=2623355 RepID=UPI00364EC43F
MTALVAPAGDEPSVRAVAREAVAVLRSGAGRSGAARSDAAWFDAAWFDDLRDLHRRRRHMVRTAREPEPLPEPSPAERSARRRSTAYRAVWGTVLGVGLLAVLVLAPMFAPPGRKNAFIQPEDAASLALVAAWVAVPALLVGLALRVPDREAAVVGETFAVTVGGLAAALLIYRAAVGTGDGRGFTAADLAWWVPATAAAVALAAGIALRCDRARRRGPAAPPRRPQRASGTNTRVERELRRTAERLAARPVPDDVEAAWQRRLAVLGRRAVDPETLVQARATTPVGWLVSVCHDAHTDLAHVLAGR